MDEPRYDLHPRPECRERARAGVPGVPYDRDHYAVCPSRLARVAAEKAKPRKKKAADTRADGGVDLQNPPEATIGVVIGDLTISDVIETGTAVSCVSERLFQRVKSLTPVD